MPLVLGMLVDVFFGKAGEEDTVEAGVESVEVGATHVTDTRLGLKQKNKQETRRERLSQKQNQNNCHIISQSHDHMWSHDVSQRPPQQRMETTSCSPPTDEGQQH